MPLKNNNFSMKQLKIDGKIMLKSWERCFAVTSTHRKHDKVTNVT